MLSRAEAESLVRSWGFSHVFSWTDGRYAFFLPSIIPFPPKSDSPNSNAYYSAHSHEGLTTHLILRGTLTITYPNEPNPEKTTYGVGDRIDVEAGRVHEVWVGEEGCQYVIGE